MKSAFFTVLLMIFNLVYSQTIITQFKFNSSFPDANTGSGTLAPSTGIGTISVIGGVTSSYATGSANDPATLGLDNSALNTTSYPAATNADKTAGIQINVGTVGDYGIILDFDQRNSSTAADEVVIQYSIDGINFIDFTTLTTNTSNTFISNSVNFSSITALNNNANARFRIVTSFAGDPGTSYTGTSSTYATSGTLQFDMVTVSSGGTLPIYCRSFSASVTDSKTKLNWIASCSNMNNTFEIQRSTDGVNFYPQLTLTSKGLNENEYSATDNNPIPGISFYRLKLIDVDGKYSYSQIVKVKNTASSSPSLTIYPNPATDKVQVEWNGKINETGYIRLSDMQGKVIKKLAVTSRAGINKLDVNVNNLQHGSYSLQLIIGDEKLTAVFNKD